MTLNTGRMKSRPYAAPPTLADLPAEIRAVLDEGAPLQEPSRQGRTSRVAFAFDASGSPVALKRSTGRHLEVLRREHRALRAVHPLGVPVPEPLLFVERPVPPGQATSGQEGWLVTRRLLGTTLEEALRTGLDRDRRAALLVDFGTALARLHATRPPPGFGSADWLENFLTLASRLNPAADTARFGELRIKRSAPRATALIHGDLFLDNVMTAGGRVTGFIDWSFADVGDPRYDVAVATHELTWPDLEAFVEGYGPAARLTAKEAADFVELALLF